MSDRYRQWDGEGWRTDCGSILPSSADGIHDAFHDRIDRLEQHLSPTLTLGESHRLTVNADEPREGSVAVFCDEDGELIPMKRLDGLWVGRFIEDCGTWAECLKFLGEPIAVHVPGGAE